MPDRSYIAVIPASADKSLYQGAPDADGDMIGFDSIVGKLIGDGAASMVRTILRFDLNIIPVYAEISTANLILTSSQEPDSLIVSASFATGTPKWVESQATWNSRATGVPWGILGGDVSDVIESVVLIIARDEEYTWTISADRLEDRLSQRYCELGMKRFSESPLPNENNKVYFYRRESEAPYYHPPRLEIAYTVPEGFTHHGWPVHGVDSA